ncbi:hypothetical protein L509_3442 [Bordetella bronchiseptica M85/00/2]|nr:hypothetical protein L509_3442 [Bordetella bronchiseptica M85/00/2]
MRLRHASRPEPRPAPAACHNDAVKKHPSSPAACPCGKPRAYPDCCGRWHAGALFLQAPDAESLMRSRYSAFVLDQLDYLLQTWHPDTRPSELEPNAADIKWLGLQIKASQQQDDTHATVEFVARLRQAGRATRLHELSRFVKEEQRWYYVDGDIR